MVTRRGFFGRVLGAVAAVVVLPLRAEDPPLALAPCADPVYDALNAVTLKEYYASGVMDDFFTSTPLLTYLREGSR